MSGKKTNDDPMDFLPFSSFGLCTQISSNFIRLVLVSCLADWSPRVFCHISFFLLFSSSMILPSCFSMFERRLHTFFLLRSLDLYLNLSVCSIQHQKEPSSESFQSNYFSTIPLRIRLPFCPLIFRYSAWSSIVLNTRWTYSQSFASNCNGCLVSLPAW